MNLDDKNAEQISKKIRGQAERIRALEAHNAQLVQALAETEAVEMSHSERIEKLMAHNAVLREALVVTHDLYAHASSGYGFARPDNPHNFSPDFECCSQEEIAAHSKACEDYDAGRKISNESWGIGAYCDEYAPALKALASTPEQSLSSIRQAERERCAKKCDEIAWAHPNTHMLGPELNATKCATAIRQMED